jgi:hypothetical protein
MADSIVPWRVHFLPSDRDKEITLVDPLPTDYIIDVYRESFGGSHSTRVIYTVRTVGGQLHTIPLDEGETRATNGNAVKVHAVTDGTESRVGGWATVHIPDASPRGSTK